MITLRKTNSPPSEGQTEKFMMKKDPDLEQCDDMAQELNIRIPCRLAERIEAYAQQNKTEFSQVVIEALDSFLRRQIKE